MLFYVLAAFGSLVVAGLWVFGYRLRKAGGDAISARIAEKTANILRKEEEAAAKASKTKDAMLDRLDKGTF